MIGMQEFAATAAGLSTELLESHEEFTELFKDAVKETQQGVSLGIDMFVAVGRKPGN